MWAPASVKVQVGARALISGYCICFLSISSEEGAASSAMVAGLSGRRVGVRNDWLEPWAVEPGLAVCALGRRRSSARVDRNGVFPTLPKYNEGRWEVFV